MTTQEIKAKTCEWGIELVKSVGFPIIVAGLLLWFGHEIVMGDRQRIDQDSDFIRNTLTEKMQQSTAALVGVKEALRENTKTQERVRAALDRQDR